MSSRSWALDIAIAAAVGALGVAEALWGVGASHLQGPVWAQAALYVVTAALLVVRRVWPIGCQTAIVVVNTVEFAAFGSPEGNGVALAALVATYSVGRYVDRRRSWWGLVLALMGSLAWSTFDPLNHQLSDHVAALVWMSPGAIAWLAGALVRSRSQVVEQRRVNRQQRAARAVAEERNRIARELHDVIGHSVSVMTVQAAAVRRRLTPEQDVEREALRTVERAGREALQEMRRMVGVLREAGAEAQREPPPGLAQVDRLVAEMRSAGLPVELTVTGHPRDLPGGLDLTAYRLVQEGLTNAMRHAVGPRLAEVAISYGDTAIEVSVRDDGGPVPGGTEAGHGLLGMRERVAVYGGKLVARPRTGGGFELLATLPVEAT
jgi:signal transduction histidine kinase